MLGDLLSVIRTACALNPKVVLRVTLHQNDQGIPELLTKRLKQWTLLAKLFIKALANLIFSVICSKPD